MIRLDIEEMKRMYYDERMTTIDIAKYYNCSLGKIEYFMRKHNLERRSKSEALSGIKRKKDTCIKMSISKKGKNNPMWKEDVGYEALHAWVRRNKKRIDICEDCNEAPSHDLANISGKYKRDVNDFEWVCRRCHMKNDGRILNLFGGFSKGEKHIHSILTENDVNDILKNHKKISAGELAKQHNVVVGTIYSIHSNQSWKHVKR